MTRSNKKANHGDHIDRIGDLPSHVIVSILCHLPVTDLVKTSTLSRKWRHLWASVPRLEFGHGFFQRCKYKHLDIPRIITDVLSLHNGPLHKFTLEIPSHHPIKIRYLGEWILSLSRSGIRHLVLEVEETQSQPYEMPSHLFSCEELACLVLRNFKLSLPYDFRAFKALIELHLSHVRFASDALERLISSCPLLNVLTLSSCSGFESINVSAPSLKVLSIKHALVIQSICLQKAKNLIDLTIQVYIRGENFVIGSISNLFQELLKLERLRLGDGYTKVLAAGTIPQKLPSLINSLKYLELKGVDFCASGELLLIICLLKSSPNLVELVIKSRITFGGPVPDHSKELEYDSCRLCQLKTVNINVNTDYKHALELIRFLLANSSSLEILTFKVGLCVGLKPLDTSELLSVARYLLQMGRASQKAQVKFLYEGIIK